MTQPPCSPLELLSLSDRCSLYQLQPLTHQRLKCYISSTRQSRAICNDPFVMGVSYTDQLRAACTATLQRLMSVQQESFIESQSVVLHILRGGLNFGLREALHQAFGWNSHVSGFISAQRQRQAGNSEAWEITEREYRKVYLPDNASIIFGDVVATGTSLRYALEQLQAELEDSSKNLRSLLFFTIGAGPTEDALADFDSWAYQRYSSYEGTSIVYLEGRFAMAEVDTPVRIKLTGTDLLRRDSILAPEFIASQSEDPAYPIERCTIYDAGSRAFWLPEYLEDVEEYWKAVYQLALEGLSYEQYLRERFPEAELNLHQGVDLRALCQRQLEKL